MLSINDTEEFFHELNSHWFPIEQSLFEVFGPRIRVLHVELPPRASQHLTVSFVTGNILLTRLQTDRQTHNHLFRKTLLSVERT